jgi:hypothetical protein
MTHQTLSISAHLCHAGEIIDAIARATVSATPDARQSLAHIDAAKSFILAAEALYEAAERVALGQPVDTPELVFWLRAADAKAAEGRALLAGE